jgi:hypothetical protein
MLPYTLDLQFQIAGIGATSGLILKGEVLNLVSDNSSFLYQYKLQEKTLHKIKLLEDSEENSSKKDKMDFEVLAQKGEKLFLFGSGSTSKREKRISYHLGNKNVKVKDLTSLYKKMKEVGNISDSDFNIEGAIFHHEKWILFQRGNGENGQNGLFEINKKKKIQFTPIALPSIQNTKATFTDALLVDDKIYFLAAAEASDSTYADGAILGSLIGCLSLPDFRLVFTQTITTTQKFEGLSLYKKTENQMEFLLCEDNDSEELLSNIYKLTIQL